MATAIHDQTGRVVGWLDGHIIRDIEGHHKAFIHSRNIYSYSSQHLGVFQDGYFRDRFGHAVAFIRGARGGPLPPLPQLPPLPPLFPLAPLEPLPPLAPLAPIPSLNWSSYDFNQFLSGED